MTSRIFPRPHKYVSISNWDAYSLNLPEFFIMPFAAQEYSILLQKLKSLSDEFFIVLSQLIPYTIISDKSKDFTFITDDK